MEPKSEKRKELAKLVFPEHTLDRQSLSQTSFTNKLRKIYKADKLYTSPVQQKHNTKQKVTIT